MAYTNIDRSSDYFRTKLYTGTGSSASITFDETKAMQPDFVWIKSRSNAYNNMLFDVLRGAGTSLFSNSTTGDEVNSPTSTTSFNSNGFSLGTNIQVNNSGSTFANWSWKANGTGVSNTSGTISSTVSANTTSGFSIVSYTGTGSNATVGHGLGSTPKFIAVKKRSAASNWGVQHANYSILTGLAFNSTAVDVGGTTWWNSTLPTSSVFSVGTDTVTNASSATFIAYCFAEVKGFSKFGSYTGNNSTDGTFIYTGFKPAFVMIKTTSASEAWNMGDNKRNITYPSGANVNNAELYANSSSAETDRSTRGGGITQFDMLSNGFKCRGANPDINYSGYNYIYMAFAESPFVSSKGIPTTAR